jgi:hypothetical protein
MTVEAHNVTIIDRANIGIAMTRTDSDERVVLCSIILGPATQRH